MVVQALELLKADSSRSDLEDADEHLKRAADMCSESGEAWYYRSLVEDRLGHKPQADFAMRKARMFPSEALAEAINPFVLAAPRNAEPLGPIHEKWALVIGIGSFSDKSIEALQYSTSDAQYFRETLTNSKYGGFKPDHVKMLTDDAATLRGVKEALNWLARSAQPDDVAVVYVASHGSARELDTAGANYILTHDTDTGRKINPATGEPIADADATADELYATALPMVELANAVATRLKARRSAVFIDTCYSGGAVTPGGKLPAPSKTLAPGIATASVSTRTLDQIRQGTGRVIFTASETRQESYESEKIQHGYFTYSLVQALRQHPEMPLSQLFAAVRKQVSESVDNDPDLKIRGLHQTPVMSRSDDDADFALGASVSSPTVARSGSR
jgi:uncharacterized caspase-like protein